MNLTNLLSLGIKPSCDLSLHSNKIILDFLKNVLGISTKNISLYKIAFRHKSATNEIEGEIKTYNERLEYLGDAILSAIVADYLYHKFPYKNEGFLTLMRSKIVSRKQLNLLAVKMGIHEIIESKRYENNENKSIYGNTFEALIGAVGKGKEVEFNIVKEIGAAHKKKYFVQVSVNNEVSGSGQGFSKKEAEQQASKNALETKNEKKQIKY